MRKFLKGAGIFFAPVIVAVICMLIGQKYPVFNAIGVTIVGILALAVIVLFFVGIYKMIFNKKK